MSAARGAACFAVALTIALQAGSARADDEPKSPASLPQRAGTVVNEDGDVRLTTAYRDVIDADVTKKLTSGLPTVIALRAYVFAEGGSEPLALGAKSCRIVYDLWDEVFRIQLTQPGGTKNTVAVNLEGVLRQCAEARRLSLVERSALSDDRRYFVAALVEVNPISAEMLERIKRWVTRPNASAAIGPGDSLFGSFVGLFVTKVPDADKKLAFRTPAFAPPAPEKKE
jgi:hypothetical protein